jgi:iron complex outermembrane receptor protein
VFVISNIAPGRHLVEISFVGYSTFTGYVDIQTDSKKDFSLSESIMENSEVVVTGVSTATQLRRTPTPVMVIKKQDLTRITATNLIDAISRKRESRRLAPDLPFLNQSFAGLGIIE